VACFYLIIDMPISERLLKKLSKQYTPGAFINMQFGSKDIAFKTDAEGNPVQLFIGKQKENGNIKGLRYSRVLIRDMEGRVIKDHWDLKGKST
jgi:hypothetical protein